MHYEEVFCVIYYIWGPVLLFAIGGLTSIIGIGILVLVVSFFVMPIVVLKIALDKYGPKVATMATFAIVIPIVAINLNIHHGFISGPEQDIFMTYYDEYVIADRVDSMAKVLAIAEPALFLVLLRKQSIWTIIPCLLDILIWIVGIILCIVAFECPHVM